MKLENLTAISLFVTTAFFAAVGAHVLFRLGIQDPTLDRDYVFLKSGMMCGFTLVTLGLTITSRAFYVHEERFRAKPMSLACGLVLTTLGAIALILVPKITL